MLNLNKIKDLEKDNHNLYHELLIQLSIHSDSNPNLMNIVEKISIQMGNMVEVINYLLKKEKENG